MTTGWIGVDFDSTLALYNGFISAVHVGDPIPAMVERVKAWRAQGIEVRIFTARATDKDNPHGFDVPAARLAIEAWCLEHIGEVLPITHEKDFLMIELWDDRCVAVEPNTGRQLSPSRMV